MTRRHLRLFRAGASAAVCVATACATASGCAGTTPGPAVQLDADVDDRLGGTGPESGDVRGASDQVARAIAGACAQGLIDSVRPRVALMPVRNLSRFRVDPQLLRNRLTHDLVQHARGRYDVVPIDDDTQTANAALTLKNRDALADKEQRRSHQRLHPIRVHARTSDRRHRGVVWHL